MNKVSSLLLLVILFTGFISCKKNNSNPPPPPPTKTISIDKTLLTGWWAPAKNNPGDKSKIYFGTDGFYFSDTAKSIPPGAGFWKPVQDSIYIGPSSSTIGELVYFVTKLTTDSLVFKIQGSTIHSYFKVNLPGITSTPISTIAGTGATGYSGDGGRATVAQLDGQGGIITDKLGNIYFCDRGNNVVRKISATDGTITTIAGGGSNNGGTFINNIPATSAFLVSPAFLAMDANGNIYVSEPQTNRVDKISAADGKISCFAGNIVNTPGAFKGDGGPAVSATLNEPQGLAVDAAGNLFIADLQNYRIRKVFASDGKITTIAGTGTDAYNGDGGLATAANLSVLDLSLDAAGDIYFTDFAHHCIRKIAVATGLITTIAGTGIEGGSGDGGEAINARLKLPFGIKVAANGDIYVADIGNYVVRKVDGATGIINKIAGTGFTGYSGDGIHATAYSFSNPYGIALDGAANVYVNDANRIRKIAAN